MVVMDTLLMCGGMLYLYSCTSVKLDRVEENDDLKIVINFNPFYPFDQYLIKAISTIPHRRYKEERQNKQSNERFEGFQESNNNIEIN